VSADDLRVIAEFGHEGGASSDQDGADSKLSIDTVGCLDRTG
jgi:hypothetical protein